MTPQVSIIIPAYNAGATIERALRSALEQTMSALEVIVVDDASTDDTAARVEALQREDARIILLRHERNCGPAAARNTAARLARSVWIAPLDADDTLHPERLERLCALAEQLGADLMADNLMFDTFTRPGQPPNAYPDGFLEAATPLTAAVLIDSDMPRNHSRSLGFLKPLMRSEFLRRHGLHYDEDLRVAEDFNLYLSAVLAGARFCCTSWAGYRYFRVADSLTRSPARFLKNLEYELEGNRRLSRLAERVGDHRTHDLLRQHSIRLELVYRLDLLRPALRARQWRQVLPLLVALPMHPLTLIRFVTARILSGPRHKPLRLPVQSRK